MAFSLVAMFLTGKIRQTQESLFIISLLLVTVLAVFLSCLPGYVKYRNPRIAMGGQFALSIVAISIMLAAVWRMYDSYSNARAAIAREEASARASATQAKVNTVESDLRKAEAEAAEAIRMRVQPKESLDEGTSSRSMITSEDRIARIEAILGTVASIESRISGLSQEDALIRPEMGRAEERIRWLKAHLRYQRRQDDDLVQCLKLLCKPFLEVDLKDKAACLEALLSAPDAGDQAITTLNNKTSQEAKRSRLYHALCSKIYWDKFCSLQKGRQVPSVTRALQSDELELLENSWSAAVKAAIAAPAQNDPINELKAGEFVLLSCILTILNDHTLEKSFIQPGDREFVSAQLLALRQMFVLRAERGFDEVEADSERRMALALLWLDNGFNHGVPKQDDVKWAFFQMRRVHSPKMRKDAWKQCCHYFPQYVRGLTSNQDLSFERRIELAIEIRDQFAAEAAVAKNWQQVSLSERILIDTCVQELDFCSEEIKVQAVLAMSQDDADKRRALLQFKDVVTELVQELTQQWQEGSKSGADLAAIKVIAKVVVISIEELRKLHDSQLTDEISQIARRFDESLGSGSKVLPGGG